MKFSHFFLKLIWYLGSLLTLAGCESIPTAYGIPVPNLGHLTVEQQKSLQEDYYLIPKDHYPSTYPSTSGSIYLPGYYGYESIYHRSFWQLELARQQAEHAWLADQHRRETEHQAWETARHFWEQPQPNTSSPPSSSFECSATSPCKQFRER